MKACGGRLVRPFVGVLPGRAQGATFRRPRFALDALSQHRVPPPERLSSLLSAAWPGKVVAIWLRMGGARKPALRNLAGDAGAHAALTQT